MEDYLPHLEYEPDWKSPKDYWEGTANYDYNKDDPSNNEPYWIQDLTIFSNLKRLKLYQLYGDLEKWQSILVSVLKESPQIKILGLSVGTSTIGRLCRSGQQELYFDFFKGLCQKYEEEDGQLLHLHSLLLGQGVYLYRDLNFKEARVLTHNRELLKLYDDEKFGEYPALYLAKLTDLGFLQHVNFQNENIWDFVDCISFYEGEYGSSLGWATCSPDFTPNLRRLTGHQYHWEVGEFLKTLPRDFSAQLSIPGFQSKIASLMWEDNMHPNMPLPFRMLDIDLSLETEDGRRTPQAVFNQLVRTQSASLEGLRVTLSADNLALSLLEGALSRLSKLTQLMVFFYGPGEGERTARRLANAGDAIRYIMVGDNAWSVTRHIDSSIIFLSLLDNSEIVEIELFAPVDIDWSYLVTR